MFSVHTSSTHSPASLSIRILILGQRNATQHIRFTISMWNPNEIAKSWLISLCFQNEKNKISFFPCIFANLNNANAEQWRFNVRGQVQEWGVANKRWVTRKNSLFINFIFVLLFYQNTFTHAALATKGNGQQSSATITYNNTKKQPSRNEWKKKMLI